MWLTLKRLSMQLTQTEINTLAKAGVIPEGTPPAIVSVFAQTCRQHNLSPFKKEIYLVKYPDRYVTIVGIDGLRSKAARTGQLAGCDDIKFNLLPDGTYQTATQLKQANKLPQTATATVYRLISGTRCPFTHTAVFVEFYPSVASGQKTFTKAAQMPFQMISKVAEAFALKKGFSDELSGLSIEEEQAAYNGATVEAVGAGEDVFLAINAAQTIDELITLYKSTPNAQRFADAFTNKKKELTNG